MSWNNPSCPEEAEAIHEQEKFEDHQAEMEEAEGLTAEEEARMRNEEMENE